MVPNARADLVAEQIQPGQAILRGVNPGFWERAANYRNGGLASFVGRYSEVEAIGRRLADNRLMTISGPGGVGKTRLALHVASRQSGVFADGVRVVALESLRAPSSLARVVAAELDTVDVLEEAADCLAAFLADKSLLLVLGNCEHMVEACGIFVERILAVAPAVRILVTSRHVLGIDGETIFPIRPLPVPRVVNGELVGPVDAVKLFADRASAVTADFEVTDANQEAVVRICELLDGMPLAIELATAWLSALSVADLLKRIEDRRGLPSRANKSKPVRHQALVAVLDWSYELCSSEEQVLWARLSVFAGEFTLAAAEATCVGDPIRAGDVLSVMAGLVDKSVVFREKCDRSTRYRMLNTSRQYGRDRLDEAGQTTEFRARHCQYYLGFAESVADNWPTSEQIEIVAWVRGEQANLRAALEFGLGDSAAGLTGARLAAQLNPYWQSCGLLAEGRRWLDRALARDDLPDGLRVDLLASASCAAATLGDEENSLRLAEQAVQIARQIGDAVLLSRALVGEGMALFHAGDLNRAEVAHQQSITWYERIKWADRRACPPYLGSALVALASGDPQRAETYAQRIIDFSVERGELSYRSYGHCAMAISRWMQDDMAATRSHAAECVQIAAKFNDPTCLVFVAETLADVAMVTGEYSRAAGILGLAERLWVQMGGAPQRSNAVLPSAHRKCAATLQRLLGTERFTADYKMGVANSTSLELAAKFLCDGTTKDPGPLTRRQMDVAKYLAYGWTNKEIAAELSISPRTVDVHIDHILRKLGFSSRVQIGVWFASRG